MPTESAEITVEGEALEVFNAHVDRLQWSADKLTAAMVWMVGYTCGQAGWSLSKILDYAKPLFDEGRRQGVQAHQRARSQGPTS